MSVTKYLKWFEDHPGKMTDTYSHLGSSDADTVAYFKHEYGATAEDLRKFTSGEAGSEAQRWLMRTLYFEARCLRPQM